MKKEKYYVAELENPHSYIHESSLDSFEVSNNNFKNKIATVKRMASKSQCFVGTVLVVYFKRTNGSYTSTCYKNAQGKWINTFDSNDFDYLDSLVIFGE